MKYRLCFLPSSLYATCLSSFLLLVCFSVVSTTDIQPFSQARVSAQDASTSNIASSGKRFKAARQAVDQKDYLLAKKECEEALNLNPNNVGAKTLLAEIQATLDALDKSITEINALYGSEEYAALVVQAREIRAICVNYPAADSLYAQAARVLITDGWNEYGRDRVTEASALAREALEFLPNDPAALELLNMCAEAQGFSQVAAGSRITFTYRDTEFAFRYCPPGAYKMGSPSSEKNRRKDEEQRGVVIREGFWICETETTQEQWNVVGVEKKKDKSHSGEKIPVSYVTWNECDAFVKKLNELNLAPIGWRFDLPTEEEWEYACRAGISGEFHWKYLVDHAHFLSSRHNVAELTPNQWGVYDMLGNVSEWTRSHYNREFNFVVRGGCGCEDGIRICRPAWRGYGDINASFELTGFRVALYPDPLIQKSLASSSVTKESEEVLADSELSSTDDVTNAPSSESGVFSQTEPGALAALEYNGIEFTFHYCPAGSYQAGSPANEKGRSRYERQRKVDIREGFWICETETTQAQWNAVGVATKNKSQFVGDNLPMETISWNECDALIRRLNELGVAPEGWRFALPTEDQWEYACRAGTTGSDYGVSLDKCAWYDGNSGNALHEVGAKEPNRWGLYDMVGNVSEWTSSQFESGNVSSKVYRGGNWKVPLQRCRPAYRFGSPSGSYANFLGVRLVLVPAL